MPLSILRDIPLFAELNDEELTKLAGCLQTKEYKKDSTVVSETDEGSTLFIINKGQVKISRTSESKKEVILAILGEGDFFGEMSLLDGLTRSANVITIKDSELFLLRREDFLVLTEKNPQIAVGLLKELAFRLRKSDAQIKSLSLFDAAGRVATALIQIAEDTGTIKDGVVRIQNLPSQQDLANIAGTSRETISRVLNAFIADKLIKKSKGSLFINNYEKFKRRFS
ncbi:Crp/Fnr family transcriptional regulator [bacterium SM23_31]|nr:MAG: Crp/Fnr family transcriptional regulator [bacterium SM23_31]